MAKRIKKRKAGLPPGSIIYTGSHKVDKVFLNYLKYDPEHLTEEVLDNHDQIILAESDDTFVDWYDVRGLQDIELIGAIGKIFKIHDLILEDTVDINQRPKYEDFPNGIFIIIKAISFDNERCEMEPEQVALYFRKGLIITFQENKTDLFSSIRERINLSNGKIRTNGADYLAYALIDSIVDNYFAVLDDIEDRIDNIEDKIANGNHDGIKEEIHHLKRSLIKVRKLVSPLREALSRFTKSDSPHIKESSLHYIRDVNDHTIQIMDMIDTYRDLLNGLQDLYLSEISMKMNQVMQVLTIITTIFVPLSFMAGLYGMNFDHMPELHFKYGYYVLLGVMLCVLIGSLFFFKKKKWF